MTMTGHPSIGVAVPLFSAVTDVSDDFAFGMMGGRWVVLLFFNALSDPVGAAADQAVRRSSLPFDDASIAYFGISNDPDDRRRRGLRSAASGRRYFYDDDGAIARLYGVAQADGVRPMAFLLDRTLRLVSMMPAENIDSMLEALATYLDEEQGNAAVGLAPVLTVPRIFEPELCRELIAYHAETGGGSSGVMRDVDGKTVGVLDSSYKIRRDRRVDDKRLIALARDRIYHRLRPAVFGAFNWMATRIERYMVACYTAEERGFFSPHRDNNVMATAHRKFAVTINLNDDFDGGDLRFPEYGQRTYRPPIGGATVFNCSMLHEATPVLRGIRYAFVPFLYDEDGMRIRRENADKLVRPSAQARQLAE